MVEIVELISQNILGNFEHFSVVVHVLKEADMFPVLKGLRG